MRIHTPFQGHCPRRGYHRDFKERKASILRWEGQLIHWQSNLGNQECAFHLGPSQHLHSQFQDPVLSQYIPELSQKKCGDKVNSAYAVTHQHIQLKFVFAFSCKSLELQEIGSFGAAMGALWFLDYE